jgi:hypothetical protein
MPVMARKTTETKGRRGHVDRSETNYRRLFKNAWMQGVRRLQESTLGSVTRLRLNRPLQCAVTGADRNTSLPVRAAAISLPLGLEGSYPFR